MTERVWRYSVRDTGGRTHRGVVAYAERTAPLVPLAAPEEFRIVLLARSRRMTAPADGTAVCVPGPGSARTADHDAAWPRRIEDLRLARNRMSAYAAGSITCAMPLSVTPADVFPTRGDHPRLDRLALAIVEAREAEGVAAYVGTLRHALGLAPGADALGALGRRLSPDDPAQTPPRRAPGVMRLRRALDALRRHRQPDVSLEQFADDLRLLRVFAPDEPWPRDAMHRLLADVHGTVAPPARARRTRGVPAARRPRR